MTTYWVGAAQVRLSASSADGDLGLSLGAFAEIALEGQATALWREAGEDWRRTGAVDSLLDRDHLIHEAGPHDVDDVHPDRFPGLQRLLERLAHARRIATEAHVGQVDKNGDPYIGHPARVAARVTTLRGQAAAWLHDVLEDTAVTTSDLLDNDLDLNTVNAVLALTRRPGLSDSAYYSQVRADPIAREVKRADLADNTDPARTARLETEVRDRLARKYEHARRALDIEEEHA